MDKPDDLHSPSPSPLIVRDVAPMRRCFEIPEILLHIFELVYVSNKGRSDLAHLARTCKLFSDPALDVLWRVQSNLLALMMSFPVEVLNFVRGEQMAVATLTITKKPTLHHWERPAKYARRIRTIRPEAGFSTFGGIAVHKTVLPTLIQSCPNDLRKLFPNLLELCYSTICNISLVDAPTYMKSLFMLCTPNTLQTLSFQFPSGRNAKDTRAFLMQFRNHFATLEHLRVFADDTAVPITDLLNAFASLKKLKCLVLGLGQLTSFKSNSVISFANSPDAFSEIRTLGIHSYSMPLILQMVKAIPTLQLQRVNLHLACRITPDGLRDLFESLMSKPEWQQSIRVVSLTTSAFTAPLQAIGDLLPLQRLVHLTLKNIGLVLDDRKVEEMAKAWPMLEELCITNDVPPMSTTNATLNSLLTLSKHCPRLGNLEVRLNAREIPRLTKAAELSLHMSRRSRRSPILSIDMRSEIRDSSGVAAFLLKVYPNISLKVLGTGRVQELEHTSPWGRVSEIIDEKLGRPPPMPPIRQGPKIMFVS